MKKQFLVASVLSLCLGCSPNGMSPLPRAGVSARVLNATDQGPVSPDALFDLVVGVRMRNESRLPFVHKLLADRADALSPDDFGDLFGASRADYFRFVTWLRSQGLEIVRTTPGRTTVTVRGNAAALQAVFGITMHAFEDARGTFFASPTAVSINNEALNDVTGVIGVDGSNTWESHVAFPNAPIGQLTPANIQTQYSEVLTGTGAIAMPGNGQTVAILSTNEPTLTTDLDKYLSTYQPAMVSALAAGQYTQVFVGGMNRDGVGGAYIENVLDAEMVLAVAPFAKIVQVFTATNGAGLFADGIAYIVNEVPQAHAVSVSWGTCERGAGSEMVILNALFAQARAQGQQWFFASGDTGADGCRDSSPQSGGTAGSNKVYSAGWPASSPNVIGVGGTTIATAETAWNGAGGGPSESLDKPAYQMGVTPSDSSRDEPDVAAIAGSPGVAIIDKGSATGVGGTSAATPIFAGLYAVLVQQKAAAGKGFTNAIEQIYTLGNAGKGLTDITSGTQEGPGETTNPAGYSAGAKYDLVTGWGTPNLTSLIANWQ